jgi:four helix bundle protein
MVGDIMALATSFRDLDVYKKARAEARMIFQITCEFPKEERFSLTDQMRRSSRAVGAMIAESWAKRRYPAAFIAKLNDALGEAMETQAWLDSSLDCGYISETVHRERDAAWQQIGAMLHAMCNKADDFCRHADG